MRSKFLSSFIKLSPLIFSCFIFFVIQIQTYNLNISFRDEGFLTLNAARINQGEIPYKDFFLTTTPGTFYLQAYLMKMWGNFFLIERLFYIVMVMIILILTHVSFRLPLAISFLLLISEALLFLSPGSYAFYNIEALALFILSFFLFKKAYEGKNEFLYFLLGITGSLIFIVKQSYGLANVAIVVLLLALFSVDYIKRKLLFFLSGFIGVLVIFFSYFYINQSLDTLIYYIFYFSREVKGHRLPFILTTIIFIPIFIVIVYFLKNVKFKHKKYAVFICTAFFILGYFLISPARLQRVFIIAADPLVYFYLTILVLPLITIGFVLKKNKKADRNRIALSIYTLGLFMASASSGRDYTTVLMVSPFFLPLLIISLERIMKKHKFYVFTLVFIFILFIMPFMYTLVSAYKNISSMKYTQNHSIQQLKGIKIPIKEKEELEILLFELKSRVSSSETLLCFPYCPLLNVLVDRQSSSYFSFFYPETFRSVDQKIFIDDIKFNKPPVIVLQQKGYIEPEATYEDKRLSLSIEYIKMHYHVVNKTENFLIYGRNKK